jgi:YggT family protein
VELILVLIKFYSIALLLRYVMTSQELLFNFLGRGVALITNPLFKPLGAQRNLETVLIPLTIIVLFAVYGLILAAALGKETLDMVAAAMREMVNFLAIFFIVCVLLGSATSPSYGGIPLFIHRLGKIWVKPVQKLTKIRSNKVVIPAVILLILANAVLWGLLSFHYNSKLPVLIIQNFGIDILVTILHYLIFLLIARALLSWFNPDPRNTFVQLIYFITEPVLTPFRRIIPPLGMLDLSAFAAIISIGIAAGLLSRLFLML